MSRATAFAPGSIGNVGPGFDVLGLAVDRLGDRVTVELTGGEPRIEAITGRDAAIVPRDPAQNVASIAAAAWLRIHEIDRNAIVSIDKGLPVAGGLGGSAASSVGGAFAAALASGDEHPDPIGIIEAGLAGEMHASGGRHLDNISPIVLGGLVLSRLSQPVDVIRLPVPGTWWVALVTPHVRVETKQARSILPLLWERAEWIQQMANTAALVHAFAAADGALLRRALDDRYAEPRRASLIPHFFDVKRAALDAGAFGCSISGSGPTIFAIADEANAEHCGAMMQAALGDVASDLNVVPIAQQGVRRA
ncbi:MAG: thrB [Acidobacteria bacterium]|nr:thrB [Acidobacteriota bacterium]